MEHYVKVIIACLLAGLLGSCLYPGQLPYIANPPTPEQVNAALRAYPGAAGLVVKKSVDAGPITNITFTSNDTSSNILAHYTQVLRTLQFVETNRFGAIEADKYFVLNSCPRQTVVIDVNETSGAVALSHEIITCR